jgi:hypothetical protein
MGSEEIKTSLVNSLERGETLQKAIQTLISAGYKEKEILESSKEINVSAIHKIDFIAENSTIAKNSNLKVKNNEKTKIVTLSVVLLILVALLTLSFIFKDKLLSLIS